MLKVSSKKLAKFLVKAKKQTWAAGDGKLEYKEGDFEYKDKCYGYYFIQGIEVVRFKGDPIWAMSYRGGMLGEFIDNPKFTKQTFDFLKKALKQVKVSGPFRGPSNFKSGFHEYINKNQGNIEKFKGAEIILFKGKHIYELNYMGGLIIGK